MEFKYPNGQNKRTTSSPLPPLSDVAYVSRCPLRGFEVAPGGFSGNLSAPRVFPTVVPVNAEVVFQRELENEQIRRELEKEEIRREIIASEMALARRRELEEEVRREMASERASGRSEGISSNNNNMFGGSQFHSRSHFHVDNIQSSTQISKARPNAGHCGGKRKAVTPAVEDSESLQKKVKQEWSCELCQITATSEKGLNDHFQGKKHKAKTSMGTQKIGLDSRPEGQTLHPSLTPAHTSKLESKEVDQDVHNSNGLVGLDSQNEATTSKEAGETTEC